MRKSLKKREFKKSASFAVVSFPEKHFVSTKQVGFIAQDLEKIYPEMVITDKDGYKSVDYSRLTPVLVEAMKELNAKNEEQEKLIKALQNENMSTAEKMLKLEATLNQLLKQNIKVEAKK